MYLSTHTDELEDINKSCNPSSLERIVQQGEDIIKKVEEAMAIAKARLILIETFKWESTVIHKKTKHEKHRGTPGYTSNSVYVKQKVYEDGSIKYQRALRAKDLDTNWREANKYAKELAEEFKCEIKVTDRGY